MIRHVLCMMGVLAVVRAVPEVAKGITFSRTVKDGPGANGECIVHRLDRHSFTHAHLWELCLGGDPVWTGARSCCGVGYLGINPGCSSTDAYGSNDCSLHGV